MKLLAIYLIFVSLLPRQYSTALGQKNNLYTFYKEGAKLPGPTMSFNQNFTRGIFEFEFKTFVEKALVLYQDDAGFTDHIELSLSKGAVFFSFSTGRSGTEGRYISTKTYNDFQWHSVKVERNSSSTCLALDGKVVALFKTSGSESVFSTKLQLGAFPSSRPNRNEITQQAALMLYILPFHK